MNIGWQFFSWALGEEEEKIVTMIPKILLKYISVYKVYLVFTYPWKYGVLIPFNSVFKEEITGSTNTSETGHMSILQEESHKHTSQD